MKSLVRRSFLLPVGLLLTLLSGCATTGGEESGNDPWEPMNRQFHRLNNTLDDTILRPISEGYVAITTAWIRQGVTNFFDNAAYPNVILNDFLQGKIEQGFEDTMRLVFNTTFGIGGLIDFSSAAGLPAHDEDLGQTFAVWGLDEMAYLEVPLVGPNSVRDVPNVPLSVFLNLTSFINADPVSLSLFALNVINARASLSSAIALRDRSALDPYVFTREAYRQRRQFLIYDGEPPEEEFDRLDKVDQSSGVFQRISLPAKQAEARLPPPITLGTLGISGSAEPSLGT